MIIFNFFFAVVYLMATMYICFKFNTKAHRQTIKPSMHRFVMAAFYAFGAYYMLAIPPYHMIWTIIGWWDVGIGIVYFALALHSLYNEAVEQIP